MGAHVFLPEGQSLYYGVIKRPFFPHHGGRQWYAWWSPKGTGVPTPNQKLPTGSMHVHRDLGHLRQAVLELKGQGGAGPENPGGSEGPLGDVATLDRPPEAQEEGGTGVPPLPKKKKCPQ